MRGQSSRAGTTWRTAPDFTADRLGHLLLQAGFADVNVRSSEYFELVALAFREAADRDAVQMRVRASGFDLREGAA